MDNHKMKIVSSNNNIINQQTRIDTSMRASSCRILLPLLRCLRLVMLFADNKKKERLVSRC